MASIRKMNGKWLAEIRTKGFYKSKIFDNKPQAQAWAVAIEQQRGKHSGIVAGNTLGDAFRKYAREVSPKKKGAKWEIVRLGKLLRDPISNISLMQLTTMDLQQWVDNHTLSANTVIREFQVISSVLSTCRRQWRWMADDIARDVQKPRKPPPRDRLITEDEKNRILEALGYIVDKPPITRQHEVAIAMLIALETGMRQGEIFNMEWPHVHIDKQYLRLPDSKNGYGRDVALSTKTIQLLQAMSPQKSGKVFKVQQSVAEAMYRSAVKIAGIQNLTFHDLRHAAITELAKKLPLLALARQVGHRDIRSLTIYYNETATQLAKMLG